MEVYKSDKGFGLYFIIFMVLMYNILIVMCIHFTNSYVLLSLLKILLVVCDIYLIVLYIAVCYFNI